MSLSLGSFGKSASNFQLTKAIVIGELLISMKTIEYTQFFFEEIFPGFGTITSLGLYMVPLKAVLKATRRGTLGDLNPLPWVFMYGSCIGLCSFGMLIRNHWIFLANISGLFLGMFYNAQAIKLKYHEACEAKVLNSLSRRNREEEEVEDGDEEAGFIHRLLNLWRLDIDLSVLISGDTRRKLLPSLIHEAATIAMTLFWFGILAFVVFNQNFKHGSDLVAYCTLATQICLYISPLSTIAHVIRTKSCRSIHFPTFVVSTMEGSTWFIYYVFQGNIPLAIGNGFGTLNGIIVLLLYTIYGFPAVKKKGVTRREESYSTSQVTNIDAERRHRHVALQDLEANHHAEESSNQPDDDRQRNDTAFQEGTSLSCDGAVIYSEYDFDFASSTQ